MEGGGRRERERDVRSQINAYVRNSAQHSTAGQKVQVAGINHAALALLYARRNPVIPGPPPFGCMLYVATTTTTRTLQYGIRVGESDRIGSEFELLIKGRTIKDGEVLQGHVRGKIMVESVGQ